VPFVGEDYKQGAKVFGVSACLLFGIVSVKIGPLRFQDAKGAAVSRKHVIGTATLAVQFKTNSALI
jgi:hypothetical protein